jgi:outer membrane protein assembly factor BamE (lipoprotein component of BamABCDE complex)
VYRYSDAIRDRLDAIGVKFLWSSTSDESEANMRNVLKRRAILAVAAAALLASCASVQFGRDFDPRTQFEMKVERGVTTREAVRGWLGEPSAQGAGVNDRGERFEEWTFYYGKGTLPNLEDASLKVLQIRFDAPGRVVSYSWTGERKR